VAQIATAGPSFPWPRSLVGSLRLRFGPHFTPPCFSILDQFEKELSAGRICSFCVKLLFQVFLRGKEAQRIAHFVRQPVSECIDTPANRADRNALGLFVSYARLGAHVAPTDVPPGRLRKMRQQAAGILVCSWAPSSPPKARRLLTRGPVPPGVGCKAEPQASAQRV
jgi:hypothetical protein